MSVIHDFTQDWNKYNLNIATDRGPLSIQWSDANQLALWANLQAGLYLQKTNSLQTFYEYFPRWYQMFWDSRYQQGIFNVPDDAVILDIGCGVAVIDLLLSKYLPNSKFYLLDKDGFNFSTGIYYDKNYPKYHSWEPVIDAINTSALDTNRFIMMSPDDPWPEQLDVITSYFSYCWHYPKETYWDRILYSLKIGGKLILDVRHIKDRDVIEEISTNMKSEPVAHWFQDKIPEHIDAMQAPKEGMPIGGRLCWIRK
jgi:SAM-dependent methyltransferase